MHKSDEQRSVSDIETGIYQIKRPASDSLMRWPSNSVVNPFTPITTHLLNKPMLAFKRSGSAVGSRPLQISPSVDEIKCQWKGLMNAAAVAWSELSAAELVQIEGHKRRLIALLQERYIITRHEAEMQVKAFFDKHKG